MKKATICAAVSSVVIFFLLGLSPSTVLGQVPASSPQWTGVDGNYPYNWNYVQQNQISPGSVNRLQVNWIFPLPTAPSFYSANFQGVTHPLIAVDGIAYAVTNSHHVLAMNVKTGAAIWQKDLPVLKFNHPQFDNFCCGIGPGGINITGHYHDIWYTSKVLGKPLLWVLANNYTLFAFNALTGDTDMHWDLINLRIPVSGNFGRYGTITPAIAIDEKAGLLLAGSAVSEGTNAGRGYLQGWDLTKSPPKLIWQKYMIPPQDGSDPQWSLKSVQDMSHAYIFNGTAQIDLKSMPASQLSSMLVNDWGNFGFNGTHSYAGAGPGWGGAWAVDQGTDTAYIGTAQPSPDFNATSRPGPNLWSDAIMAVDMKTGNFVWAFQTVAHDLWDWDCSWSVLLANATISGQQQKVVYKGCKNGVLYAMDAGTGKMLWYFNAPSIKRPQYSWPIYDPRNSKDMNKPWGNYPSKVPYVTNPGFSGGIESDPAYDPTTNTVFVATFNNPMIYETTCVVGHGCPYGSQGVPNTCCNNAGNLNTTIWGVDGSTGKPKWSHFIDNVGFRGGLATSGGVVYAISPDGNLYYLDSSTGKTIGSKLIGAGLVVQPAIAADSDGNVNLVMAGTGTTGTFACFTCSTPGFLFAMSLGGAQAATATTTTATTTVASTASGPATGIDQSTFYAVSAVAIVATIAAGFFAMRQRKPAA